MTSFTYCRMLHTSHDDFCLSHSPIPMLWLIGHRSLVKRRSWTADLAHPKIFAWRPLWIAPRSKSSIPSFIQLTEPQKTCYHVKLHRNVTSSFQVMGNVISRANVAQTYLMISRGHHNTYVNHVTSILIISFSGSVQTDTQIYTQMERTWHNILLCSQGWHTQ